MSKERMIAFTDAILAIIMTILVLELEKPQAASWQALWELREQFSPMELVFSGFLLCGSISTMSGRESKKFRFPWSGGICFLCLHRLYSLM